MLPEQFPPSLKVLRVEDNPNLAGVISKQLILQCDNIIHSGCKPPWDAHGGKKNTDWMQGPFIVGASFASEDLGLLLYQRKELGIVADMLRDVPKKGDPNMKMTETHGDKWVAWQEVWLTGLKALQNRKVYVMSVKNPYKEEHPFRLKFQDRTSDERTAKNCFDPAYGLPAGERAFSILDWERRQIIQTARTNVLEIVHLSAFCHPDGHAPPSWYTDAEALEAAKKQTNENAAAPETATEQINPACCCLQ